MLPRALLLSALLLAADVPPTLVQARKRAEQLRYEEAVVEYQRYLGEPARPPEERARALLELAFLHFVLGDEASARLRAFDALTQDRDVHFEGNANRKQQQFLNKMRNEFDARAQVEVLRVDDAAGIAARVADPLSRVSSVSLRHALSREGPWLRSPMTCHDALCNGRIPPPVGVRSWTAWFFLEATDAEGNTLARAGDPSRPFQVSVIEKAPWYEHPLVWVGGAVALVGIAGLVYVVTAPSR